MNKIYHGDCIDWLKEIPPASIDMCYIDPPFFTQRDFSLFNDRWYDSDFYIGYMKDRVKAIHRVLKPTGSIFLHCDWHSSHKLRFMLDQVFGEGNFRNEIIWCYTGPSKSSNFFPRKHDTIFFYTKGGSYVFNKSKIRIPYKRKTLSAGLGMASGKKSKEEIKKAETKWIKKGKIIEDYWIDIPSGSHISKKERTGYETQKPEKLLERIIKCSTNEGDVVLDCFGGSGTTAAVAKRLGRKFITGDISEESVRIIKERTNEI